MSVASVLTAVGFGPALAAVGFGPALAGTTFYTDQSSFAAAAGRTSSFGFDNVVAAGTSQSFSDANGFTRNGVNFVGNAGGERYYLGVEAPDYYSSADYGHGLDQPSLQGPAASSYFYEIDRGFTAITFLSGGVTAFGLNLFDVLAGDGDGLGTDTVSLRVGDATGSVTTPQHTGAAFLGFVSSSPIRSVVLSGSAAEEFPTITNVVLSSLAIDTTHGDLASNLFSLASPAARADTVNFDGGILQLGDQQEGTSNFVTAPVIIDANNGTVDTNGLSGGFSGSVSGPGALTITGGGAFSLTGPNSYQGGTTLVDGTLSLSHAGQDGGIDAAGTGAVTLQGGTLETTLTGTLGNAIAISANASATIAASTQTQLTLAGDFSLLSSSSVTFGTLCYGGTIVFAASSVTADPTASLVLNAGTLQAASGNSALGTLTAAVASVTINGGTLDFNGNDATIANLQGSGGTLTNAAGATTTIDAGIYAGRITGEGAVTKDSGGTLTLAGSNTYTGGTQLVAGTLSLAHARQGDIDAAGSGGITLGGGTLEIAVSGNLTNAVAVALNATASLGATLGTTATLTGAFGLGASSAISVGSTADPGTIVFAASSVTADPTASLVLNAGTLQAASGNSALGTLTAAVASVTIDGGTLDFNGNSATVANLQGNGGVLTNAAGATTTIGAGSYAGLIAGGGALVKAGNGGLALLGPNTYLGGTLIEAGTLSLGHASLGAIDAASGGPIGLSGGTLETTVTGSLGNAVALLPEAAAGIGAATATTLTLAGPFGLGANAAITFGSARDQGTILFGPAATTVASPSSVVLDGGILRAAPGNAGLGLLTAAAASVTINGGTLDFNGNAASIANLQGNGGVLTNATGTQTTIRSGSYAGQITGGTTLVVAGGGVLTLAGQNSYTGGTLVRSGVLSVGSATALGTGPVSLDEGTTLAFALSGLDLVNAIVFTGVQDPTIDSGSGSSTVSGVISGPGALTKTGSGTLDLTAIDTYTGSTTIAAGTLLVDGSIAASAVTIGNGATLGGHGTVGSVAASAGSTLQPGVGAAYETLNVLGGVAFAPGSTFAVKISPSGQTDAVVAGGKASLGGATLALAEAPGSYTNVLSPYLILTAQSVSGTFGTVTSNNMLAFVDPKVVYGVSGVSLTFARNDTSFASVAKTPNQAQVAAAIESLGPASQLYATVLGQTRTGAQQPFTAAAGTVQANAASAAIQTSRFVSINILDRLFSIAGSGLDARQLLDQLSPNALPTFVNCYAPLPTTAQLVPANVTFWGEGFGSFGSTGGSADAAGLDHSLGGFVLGADTPLHGFSAPYRIGLAGGYTADNFDLKGGGASGTAETVFGSLYGSARYGSVDVRLGASYAGSQTSTLRTVAFPGFNETERANYGGSTVQGFGEVGYRIASSRLVIEPVIDAAIVHIHQDRFAEEGGAAALIGFAEDSDSASTTLGVRAEAALFNGLPLIARTFLGWRHGYGTLNPAATFAFAAGSIPFSSSGAPIDRDALAAEAGLDWRASSKLTLGVSYLGQIGSRDMDNSIRGRMEYKF